MVQTTKEAASMGELAPRIRAGDKDRQRIVEKLGEHMGEGRLTVTEFDERVVRAHAAVYLDELPALMADLPTEPAVTRRRSTAPPPWGSRDWGPQAAIAVLMALVLVWSVAAVVQGAPPIFAFLLLFLFLKHRRWSRRS
jgi:hypothetical protein